MRLTSTDYKERVFRCMNFISANIERDLSLEEIAGFAAFSMFHFHRIFKAVVGETVAGFTRRLRLELAANRLVAQRFADITTIAMESGFSSSQNFSKAFRQHFLMTPSAYRRSKRPAYDTPSAPARSLGCRRGIAIQAEVKEIPERTVAFVRRVGPYSGDTCGPAFAELLGWALPRRYVGPGKLFAIYWDNPDVTPPEKCRFDTCIHVPEGTLAERDIFIQTVRGGPYALCRFEEKPENIQRAWEDAFLWICDSGYECADAPCLEVYQNNAALHPEGKWIFDICIPLS